MRTAEHLVASMAIAVTLIAGCAKAPPVQSVGKDTDEDAVIKRNMAEFAEAVELARKEQAQAALAKAKQRATPAQASAGTGVTSDQKDVSAAIAKWAAAWSRKDVKGYLAAYAKDFAVPRGRSRRQWEAERRARIVGKSWIDVKIEALDVTVDNNTARVRFQQSYRSDRFTENSTKTLVLVKTNEKWLIQREQEER